MSAQFEGFSARPWTLWCLWVAQTRGNSPRPWHVHPGPAQMYEKNHVWFVPIAFNHLGWKRTLGSLSPTTTLRTLKFLLTETLQGCSRLPCPTASGQGHFPIPRLWNGHQTWSHRSTSVPCNLAPSKAKLSTPFPWRSPLCDFVDLPILSHFPIQRKIHVPYLTEYLGWSHLKICKSCDFRMTWALNKNICVTFTSGNLCSLYCRGQLVLFGNRLFSFCIFNTQEKLLKPRRCSLRPGEVVAVLKKGRVWRWKYPRGKKVHQGKKCTRLPHFY